MKVPLFQHSSGAKPGLRRRILGLLAGAACALGGFALAVSPAPAADSPEGNAFFESRIRPLLIEHFYECHSTERKKLKGGLALDTREGIQKGGESGLLLEPGNPDASRLIEAVRYQNRDFQMPPKNPLPAHAVRDLEQWARAGCGDGANSANRGHTNCLFISGEWFSGVHFGKGDGTRFFETAVAKMPGAEDNGGHDAHGTPRFLARPATIPRARATESEQKAISAMRLVKLELEVSARVYVF